MKRKLILIIILAVIVISGAFIGSYYWYQGANYVATDNARISADIYRVMPRIAGKINTLGIKTGIRLWRIKSSGSRTLRTYQIVY